MDVASTKDYSHRGEMRSRCQVSLFSGVSYPFVCLFGEMSTLLIAEGFFIAEVFLIAEVLSS